MKKTKIVCTMGPNTNDREVMKALALNGMDIARFTFSHGDYEEQKASGKRPVCRWQPFLTPKDRRSARDF